MLLTIACLLMRWVPGPAVLVFRGDLANDAELVGAENYVTSCDLRMLMDQSAEPVAPAQLSGQPVHVRLRAGRVPGAVRGDRGGGRRHAGAVCERVIRRARGGTCPLRTLWLPRTMSHVLSWSSSAGPGTVSSTFGCASSLRLGTVGGRDPTLHLPRTLGGIVLFARHPQAEGFGQFDQEALDLLRISDRLVCYRFHDVRGRATYAAQSIEIPSTFGVIFQQIVMTQISYWSSQARAGAHARNISLVGGGIVRPSASWRSSWRSASHASPLVRRDSSSGESTFTASRRSSCATSGPCGARLLDLVWAACRVGIIAE